MMATRSNNQKVRLDQEPPKDIQAEYDVLGSILKSGDVLADVIEYIPSADYFYVPKHRVIYEAILNLFEKGDPTDITTVANQLTMIGQLERVGGRFYLAELVEGIATTANVEAHARIILDKAALRQLISTSTDIVKSCYRQEYEVGELLDRAEQNVFAISQGRLRIGFTPMSELIPGTFEQIEDFHKTKGGLAGHETGYPELDSMTGGLHNGDVIVIAGRPSMGKTAFALNIAEHLAIEKGSPVGIFSIEMNKAQLALRMLCGRSKIDQHLLRTDRLKDADWQRLSLKADDLANAPIYIDDSATLTPLELRAKARRLKAQHNVTLIIVDYIQMMSVPGKIENRQQEIAQISRALKALAKELEIPVIAVSQLSRMVEMRGGDKRPVLSDLRESGAIEQDADVVMFVYRPEFYKTHLNKDSDEWLEAEGKAEIIIAKQRSGPTGTVELTFVKRYIRFEPKSAQPVSIPAQEDDFPY
jgi:replicative DNA helicase